MSRKDILSLYTRVLAYSKAPVLIGATPQLGRMTETLHSGGQVLLGFLVVMLYSNPDQ